MSQETGWRDSEYARKVWGRGIRNTLIVMATVATAWTLLSYFLPSGWWLVVVNIGSLLVTMAIAASLKLQLALLLPNWLAWLGSFLLWGIAALGVRTVELNILEALFG